MKTKVQANVSELFDQAVENFDSALKTGVKNLILLAAGIDFGHARGDAEPVVGREIL